MYNSCMKLKITKEESFWLFLTVLVSLLYGIAGSLININRLWQYELGFYDFGIFTRPILLVSKFKPPIIDHFIFSNRLNFADHFNPSIFMFSPLFWLTDRIEILLIAQSMLVGLSGIVLFFIAKKILKSSFISFAVVISYFLFQGLQNAVYSDFHDVTAAVFFMMMTYWAIVYGKKKTFFIFLIITLGFKESLFFFGIGLAVFIFLTKKEWRRIAIATGILSIVWGVVAIKFIIPRFSPNGFFYYPDLKNIGSLISLMFTPVIKVKTIAWTMVSFLFLPLLAPSTWLIMIFHYAHRFLSDGSSRWDLGLHYNAEIAPTLAIATILGVVFLQKKLPKKIVYVIGFALLSVSIFLHRFILHGPIGLAYNPIFYKHTQDFKFLDTLVSKVPKNVRVSAQNNLTPSFFHQDVWILRDNYQYMNPEYIVIDAHDGQNPANYLGIKDLKILKDQILKDKKYVVYYHEGDQYIFKKK